MRRQLTYATMLIIAGCGSEKSPQEVIAEEMIKQGQRQMAPVNDALQKTLKDLQRDYEKQAAEQKEKLRRQREGEPIRYCTINGVRTFDNRGTLCPENSPTLRH